MFGISVEHVAVVGSLTLLEALLSTDNALMLALQVRHLPRSQRSKALLYGMAGALTLRGLGLLFARQIVGLWWVCGMSAIYLIGLSIRHFLPHRGCGLRTRPLRTRPLRTALRPADSPRRSFWRTVVMVEITDFFFAIDSLMVAVALSRNPWTLYIGAALGIVLLRLAASQFLRLMERFPALDSLAYALVAWAGIKLAARTTELVLIVAGTCTPKTVPNLMPTAVFWTVMTLIVVVGIFIVWRKGDVDRMSVSLPDDCEVVHTVATF